jgi:NADH-quinone oxidoreductase subunit E
MGTEGHFMEEDQEVLSWIGEYFEQKKDKRNLIGVLLALQDRFGYLSRAGMVGVAGRMGVSAANVFGVATFYNQFRFVPPGRHPVKVCMGTACYIKQASKILDHWERRLEIHEGEVTPDREYSLDTVACVGCCTLAPVAVMGDEIIGDMSPSKVDGILLRHRMQHDQDSAGSAGEESSRET